MDNQGAIKRAKDELREIEARESAAISNVRLQFSEEKNLARLKIKEAERARDAHIEDKASHPWEGRRVFRLEYRLNRNSWSRGKAERIEGIFEIVRRDTKFAANLSSWRRPAVGTFIVRHIKKDGAAGARFKTFLERDGWELVL